MEEIKDLDKKLRDLKDKIRVIAKDYGLDFFEVDFKMCNLDAINMLAAKEGFPVRYPHWKFGMNYDQMVKQHQHGWGKIYEMVINSDPCYAYLLNTNSWMDQKLVISHVYGHSDFFKMNKWFSNTDRKMVDKMANHSVKIRKYIEQYGQDKVEGFIDQVLSLENLISPLDMFENLDVQREREENDKQLQKLSEKEYSDNRSKALKSYMNNSKGEEDHTVEDSHKISNKISRPQRDVLKFLAEEAPLDSWESDVVSMLRDEAYYFLPQRMTKIMNEGWASYWHAKMMTEKLCDNSDFMDFAETHSGVVFMPEDGFNPYKVGIELFRDIKERWDKGRFGLDYALCDDLNLKDNWDTKAMLGTKKIFEVRKSHNDLTFIDEFLTPEFCIKEKLFVYKKNTKTGKFGVDTREFNQIKEQFLVELTNFGTPVIEAVDSNYENQGKLLLKHRHYGRDIDLKYAEPTLRNLYKIWKRPVVLSTTYEDKESLMTFDENGFSQK